MSLLKEKDLFIIGPTASGKSSLAVRLAEKLNYPIVNCDSLQFFKTLKIGTAYPSEEDFKKAEHLLFGCAEAGEFFSAGEYVRRFQVLREQPTYQNQKFLITGGSGFYIKAIETGMEEVETLDDKMKHKISFLQELTDNEKTQKLKEVDPDAFLFIHENDHYRIHRALEIYFSQGLKVSTLKNKEQSSKHQTSHQKLGLYWERDELLQRVSLRVDMMLKKGLIDEVKAHIDRGLKTWKPLQSVGYKEVIMYFDGVIEKDQIRELIIKNTMNLAKRQMTWFRADPNVSWFHGGKDIEKAFLWAEDWFNV